MPDSKISLLPSSGALTGAEIFPYVQGGETVQGDLDFLIDFIGSGLITGTENYYPIFGTDGIGLVDGQLYQISTNVYIGADTGGAAKFNVKTVTESQTGIIVNVTDGAYGIEANGTIGVRGFNATGYGAGGQFVSTNNNGVEGISTWGSGGKFTGGDRAIDAYGRVVIKATANDGTSYLLQGRNSDDVLNFTIKDNGDISLADANVINVGTATGTKFGQSVSAKIGFHGVDPVIQKASASQAAVSTTASTNVTPYGFTTSAQADSIVTLVNEIRAALVEKGIIKGAA